MNKEVRTKLEHIERSIIAAVRDLGPATAAVIERDPRVVEACRAGKLKARHRLDMLAYAGKIKSDMAYQGRKFWI